MLTMALPFWRAWSKILSTDHEDSGTGVPWREEADGATERVRRDDRAGGGDELLLGAGFRADVGARSRRADGDHRGQPLQRLRRQAVVVSAGLRPLPRTNGAGPRCPAGKAAAGFGDPDIF